MSGRFYKPKSVAGSSLILVLLLVYTVSSLRLNSIHQLFHAENIAELHNVEKENNPCHKNIYHQEKNRGCQHKSHITENSKCPVCDHNVSIKYIAEAVVDFQLAFKSADSAVPYQVSKFSFQLYSNFLRGPPRLSA